jgi:cell division cycle protein 37
MIAGNQQALKVFEDDVNSTYAMIRKRAAANKEEQEKMKAQGGVEQIQLVAEDPSTVITFDVPDGPPPADLRLAPGPETEGLDVEEVRKALQARWDIFEGFDPKLKKALESNKLDNVNKVLGKMTVEEAERVVELLQIAGILQFAEGGIRDETGKGPQDGVSALA